MKANIRRLCFHRLLIVAVIAIGWMQQAGATQPDPAAEPLYTSNDALVALTYDMAVVQTDIDTVRIAAPELPASFRPVINIYDLPYSVKTSVPDWHRLWINTATLCGAYIATFGVLQLLPEDATSWNRREITSVPPFKRWWRNVYKLGPEWDHDNAIFNYILHPYAGAVYYMSARSCGFNVGQSLLYCTCISTIAWEYGIEAFMERPSIQDLFITPLVGSLMGECFYKVKRSIVNNGYRLAGSPVLGNIVVFLCDPVNEVVGLFAGNPCRRKASESAASLPEISSAPWMRSDPVSGMTYGFTVSCRF